MKRFKRKTTIILVLMIAFCLCACGAQGDVTTKPLADPSEVVKEQETVSEDVAEPVKEDKKDEEEKDDKKEDDNNDDEEENV